MKFTITKADYEASGKDYEDNKTCAMAQAARRQLNIPKESTVVTGYTSISVDGVYKGSIVKAFTSKRHAELKDAVQEYVFETEFVK
jgi:hypothetical protein